MDKEEMRSYTSYDNLCAKIDKIAYTNALAKSSPVTKILFALSSLVLNVSTPSPLIPIIVFLINTILLIRFANVPSKFYLNLLAYPTIIVAISSLIIAMFFGQGEALIEIVLPWFRWTVFKNGVTMGITTFLRVEGALSCLYFLVLTTSITDIFITLRKAHIPKILIEMSLLIYRYIFVFLEVEAQMNIAQKLRLGHSNWKRRIRSLALLSGNLFIRTLEQGERTFLAMNARGYNGSIRTLDDLPQPKLVHLFGIVLFNFILIFLTFFTMNLLIM
ncbi:MAG: cobalt ECF transporter T component CbiQ [Nitrososphaerales archaeon]